MSNMIRSLKNKISLFCGSNVNIEKRKINRARSGLPKKPTHTRSNALIYGMQGTVFENSTGPKPWQHGPYYDKPNIDGHQLDMSVVDPYGDPIYACLRSGQIVNTAKNRTEKKRKSVLRLIKRAKVAARKAGAQ